MIESFDLLWKVLVETTIIFGVLFLIFKKHIVHLFDPLLYYIITQAFSIELAFITIADQYYLINFLICQMVFLAGFFSTVGKPLQKHDLETSQFFKRTNITHVSIIKWYALFAAAVLLIANIILFKLKGIPLLSENPSAAKVEDFTEGTGLGIIRRLNSGMFAFVAVALVFLYILKKQLRYLVLFLSLMIIASMSGSKGALLYFIFLTALYSCFRDIKLDSAAKKLKVSSYFLLILSIFLAGIIISGGSSDDTFTDKVFKLASRFLFFGDAIIYYYNHYTIEHFAKLNAKDFFVDEFNSVLGFFRLVEYRPSMGFRLINYNYNLNNETFGPNIPYYIKGYIYFGYFGAFLYSFAIGAFVGYIRKLFYTLVRYGSSSIIYSVAIVNLNLIVYSLPQDSQLFIDKVSDIIILSLPIVMLVLSFHLSKNEIRPGYT